jgi:hypothetical protein
MTRLMTRVGVAGGGEARARRRGGERVATRSSANGREPRSRRGSRAVVVARP